MSDDLINRQAAIESLKECAQAVRDNHEWDMEQGYLNAIDVIEEEPSAQPTLYGYKIEHLAYIARVMEKEGVTAEYAVRTFDDMSRAIKMIIDEAEEALNERFNWQKRCN